MVHPVLLKRFCIVQTTRFRFVFNIFFKSLIKFTDQTLKTLRQFLKKTTKKKNTVIRT